MFIVRSSKHAASGNSLLLLDGTACPYGTVLPPGEGQARIFSAAKSEEEKLSSTSFQCFPLGTLGGAEDFESFKGAHSQTFTLRYASWAILRA